MRLAAICVGLCLCGTVVSLAQQQTFFPQPQPLPEAPTGFDNKSNGMVDDITHQADLAAFDSVETIADGLGPLYNAQSCRECHQDPVSGGASQVTELRAGHRGPLGDFQNPQIPIGNGAEVISGRSLVNDRAICPNQDFPDGEIHERVPESETIRTTRMSLNVLGDGFIEAVADQTLLDLARNQCSRSFGAICGQAIQVPIVEAPGATRVGRFGWKAQHASLLSFSGDAYLNEMGITTRLFPDEVTKLCSLASVPQPNDSPEEDGLDDVDRFARFIRATKAPARDRVLSQTADALHGSDVFDFVGCNTCHVRTMKTAPAGTVLNGGTYTVSAAIGGKQFHPFSDFLLHDVGTGDGIAIQLQEHFGARVQALMAPLMSSSMMSGTQNKIRTPPLWGVRMRTRLMHDGASFTLSDAILRHSGEASGAVNRYFLMNASDRAALLTFLKSL
jgi:CxxC motif-containing protein (DUF1111 family)